MTNKFYIIFVTSKSQLSVLKVAVIHSLYSWECFTQLHLRLPYIKHWVGESNWWSENAQAVPHLRIRSQEGRLCYTRRRNAFCQYLLLPIQNADQCFITDKSYTKIFNIPLTAIVICITDGTPAILSKFIAAFMHSFYKP